MPYQPVQSSMIAGYSYEVTDTASNLCTLSVTFNNGRTYDYERVPLDECINLGNAPSVGKYFIENIRGQYAEG